MFKYENTWWQRLCVSCPVTKKDLFQIQNGLTLGYLDLVSIIAANKMAYDGPYTLLWHMKLD